MPDHKAYIVNMNFPLPIRPFTSTTNFSTPLFVETNMVYNMDETKFPGLDESSHSSEPALIAVSDMSWNSYNSLTEQTETCDGNHRDSYNRIDSGIFQDAIFSPFDLTDDILDLPDIQLELPNHDAPVNEKDPVTSLSICNLPSFENGYVGHLNSLISESPDTVSLNITTNPCGTIGTSLCEFCRFPIHIKRKRKISSTLQENVTYPNTIEDLGCSKRMKSETGELHFTNFPLENCFEGVIDDFVSQIHMYPGDKQTTIFHFGLSPINSYINRQW